MLATLTNFVVTIELKIVAESILIIGKPPTYRYIFHINGRPIPHSSAGDVVFARFVELCVRNDIHVPIMLSYKTILNLEIQYLSTTFNFYATHRFALT
ncbi:hypothetical protein TNCT_555541 [Trichonephila clavata]|uniref:Uncharacterized protein n=1 Tax=Trichonephila clavata TaxID=2740835 RepID=A0A8X6LLF9_TRICU|nr:hypothetical protein TNCT_555541 [Trichonephila clavata]